MIEQIYAYFTIEILYFWVNLGVLPFWLILIFFPQSNLSKYFVTSIFPFLLLSGAYVFVLYKSYINVYDFDSNFELYLSFSNLSSLFSNDYFLILLKDIAIFLCKKFKKKYKFFDNKKVTYLIANNDKLKKYIRMSKTTNLEKIIF